ncbi:T9SS type A sorting domain-containing protein [Pontimicrobium sp. MEBiC06410]
MKTKLLLVLALAFSFTIHAQTDYRFTLIQNSGYNYTVAAVPDFDSGGATPTLDSYGFTVMLQDGASIDEGGAIKHEGGGSLSFAVYTASQLDAADPGNDRSATVLTVASDPNDDFPAHTNGQLIPLVTFDVLGAPTTGEISVLDNGSSLAMNASGSIFDSSLTVDPTGGSTPTSNYFQGQTGTTSYSFATLTVEENELTGYSIFPNPANDVVTIKGLENTLSKVEVFNIAGQKVYNSTSNMETINVSTFNAGVYFVKLSTEEASLTTKLIKE